MKDFSFEYRPGWERCAIALSHIRTHHIKTHISYFACLKHYDDELILLYGWLTNGLK